MNLESLQTLKEQKRLPLVKFAKLDQVGIVEFECEKWFYDGTGIVKYDALSAQGQRSVDKIMSEGTSEEWRDKITIEYLKEISKNERARVKPNGVDHGGPYDPFVLFESDHSKCGMNKHWYRWLTKNLKQATMFEQVNGRSFYKCPIAVTNEKEGILAVTLPVTLPEVA